MQKILCISLRERCKLLEDSEQGNDMLECIFFQDHSGF